MSTPPTLPSDLTIVSLGSLRAAWLAALPQAGAAAGAGAPPWPVDASAVDEIDAAGVQFLLSLQQALALRGHALALAEPSHRLLEACATLGVASTLGLRPEAA